MSVKHRGLGRGLDALLPKSEKSVQQLAIAELRVSAYQPRKFVDPEAIAELAGSIAEKGVLQPLLVRPAAESYEIVAGERRFRAAKQAGLASVPAIIKPLSDQETLEIALIENLQRENLNAVEEARAFKQLLDFGMNQDEVAKAVGKSRSAVANTLRLLQLPGSGLKALEEKKISAGHARAVLAQPRPEREWALEQVLARGLSVREAERLRRKAPVQAKANSHHLQLERDLTRHVGAKVKVTGEKRGKIELHFYSPDELNRLLELLGYQA